MLTVLGLTSAEQDLYEFLVPRSPMSMEALANSGIDDHLPTIDRLVRLGLVVRLPGQVAAIPPRLAFDALLHRRSAQLAETRRHLRALAMTAASPSVPHAAGDAVAPVYGAEAIARAVDMVQRSAEREVRAFDAPPYAANPLVANEVQMDLLANGTTYRTLYDRRGLEIPGRLQHVLGSLRCGEEARVVGNLPMKMMIADETVGIVPIADNAHVMHGMVVRDPTLMASLSTLFELRWTRAVPLSVYAAATSGPKLHVGTAAPTPAERSVLTLLVSGLTDSEIAAHLGWHERTVRKHVHAMKARLGATTRYQAGILAVKAGWLRGGGTDPDLPTRGR
ncbi:helix-turn-helix domain-containing protein [Micromonospora sonneratiae]|uniref:LuxR C-terminal-related transcriptional regulator n=1 Tax=Micromonospora sonneratiae TaxID=1184706 RepID=A0ABW3Y5S7_9ACTN